jgi:hypothetical protein
MPNDDQFRHGYYCIAFLDILGQRRILRELAHLSLKDEEARKLVIETSGYVLGLRKQLDQAFEGLRQLTPILDSIPPEPRKRIEAAKNIVKYRGFSDSLIMSVKFEGDAEQFGPMTGIFGCLSACSILHLIALAGKRPIRGGIDVGYGLNLTEEETYGPVLESAHFLESQIADYPRIVVGKGLPRYLDTVEREAPATPFGNAARQLATRCKTYLVKDSDGVEMLDVLGFVASFGESERHLPLFQQATEYIREQYQHGIDTDDHKHESRYFSD